MKKLSQVALVLILVLSLFSSCVLFAPNDGGSDTKANTETNKETNTNTDSAVNTEASTNTESNTNTSTETSSGTNTSTNTDIIIDSVPEEKINISRLPYTFAYWHAYETATGKSYAKLLCDDSYISIDVDRPLDITAGDMLIVEHTGHFWTQESYPGQTSLYNGEVISYSFEYSEVYKLTGTEVDAEAIRNQYDFRWGDEYVILNRKGDFISLDEYEGDTLYLVLDKYRAEKIEKNEIQPDWDVTKTPISCALAYNPRNINDGVTEAELRDMKVTIDLDYHDPYSSSIESSDPSWRYAGYIGYNENGNEYIKYAPNCYSYFALISCEDVTEAWTLIEDVRDHAEINISITDLSDNNLMVVFPDFDDYSICQEELLDGLSALDTVEKIEVSYTDNKDHVRLKSYDTYMNFASSDYDNKIITTYAEFTELFDLNDEKNAVLTQITEKTFENNYVVFEASLCFGCCVDEISIRDARLVDGDLYYTLYEYYFTDGEHCQVAQVSPALIVIPKSDLGTTLPDEFKIESKSIDWYVEDNTADMEEDTKDELEDLDSDMMVN